MALIALLFSLGIAALGALGLASPARFVRLIQSFETRAGYYTTIAARLLFGIALVLAAPGSRAPTVLWVLGLIVLAAGLMTMSVGFERFRRLLDWWLARGSGFARVWGAVALVLGALLAYAVAPR